MIQSGIYKLSRITLLAFTFSMPLPLAFARPFLVAFVLLGLLSNINEHNFSIVKIKERVHIFGFVLIFLLTTVSFFAFTQNVKEGWGYLERYLPFFVFPFAMIASLTAEDRQRVFKTFILGCICSCLYCLLLACSKSFIFENGHLVFDARIEKDPRIDFWRAINWGGNYFFSSGLSPYHHPTYLSMYLLFCIGIIYDSGFRIFKPLLSIVITILFVVFLVLLSARASQLFFLLSLFVASVTSLKAKKRKLILLAVTGFAVFILLLNPRTDELIERVKSGMAVTPSDRTSAGARIMVWSAACELIRDVPVLGVGPGDLRDELSNRYAEKSFQYPLELRLNAHNEYIEYWATLGIGGVLLLIFILINGLRKAIRVSDVPFIYFLSIIAFHALFESILQRNSGIVFFVFFYCFLAITSVDDRYNRL